MGRKTQQNRYVTPELAAQVNPENKQLKEDFVAYLNSLRRSEKTIEAYVGDLDEFFVWVVQYAKNKSFVKLTKRDIMAFQNYLCSVGNSPARIRRMKSTLSSLSNFIEAVLDDEFPEFRNIIRKIADPPAQAVREKTIMGDEQLFSLLNYLTEKQEYQKACLLALAMYSGARKAELVRFKLDFFVDENVILGSLWKTPRIKTKGRSGGKYINKFVLKNEFTPYLNLWVEQRKELGVDSEWLFVSRGQDGTWNQLKAETINSWSSSFGKFLGVDFYIHTLRHYWCTSLVKKNIPTNVITQLTGWSSEAMCSVYTDLTPEETFSKYFDENGIKDVKTGSLSDLDK